MTPTFRRTARRAGACAGTASVLLLMACKPGESDRAAMNEAGSNIASNQSVMSDDAIETENAAAESTEARSILRPEVVKPEPEAPKIEPARGVVPFGASGLKLDDAGRAAVDALLDTPAMKAGGPIVLRGHTDSRGSDGDNLVASRIRAETVRDYMVQRGIAEQRIEIVALGETRPESPNAREDGSDDPEGRARNRRVEIDIALPTAPQATPGGTPVAAPPAPGS